MDAIRCAAFETDLNFGSVLEGHESISSLFHTYVRYACVQKTSTNKVRSAHSFVKGGKLCKQQSNIILLLILLITILFEHSEVETDIERLCSGEQSKKKYQVYANPDTRLNRIVLC